MKIHLQRPTQFTIADFETEGFEITEENPALYFSALAMWVAALARCTYATLEAYGHRFDADSKTVEMTLSWSFSEKPTRFDRIDMDILWPSLEDKRIRPVQRTAQHCTIHNTIHDCVLINTTVRNT